MKRYTAQKKSLVRPGRRVPVALAGNRRGSFLVEGTIALFLLLGISFAMLQSSYNILKPRTYTIYQNMADAYLSQEVAMANRVEFDEISEAGTQWPLYPASSTTDVTIGTMPLNQADVSAQVIRTRMAYNWAATGTDALDFDDLGIQVWKLQSHLVYTVEDKQYVKSRTVIRSQ